jgi:D-amino-acid dehydrogenase
MRVVILGAGIVGITSAYMLAKRGHHIVLIDKGEAGQGASFANGGQLSYNYCTTIANPSIFTQLPKIVLGFEPAFKVYPNLDLDFYRWGLKFLAACSPEHVVRSKRAMSALGSQSKVELAKILRTMGDEFESGFDYEAGAGKLNVYSDEVALIKASENNKSILWSRAELIKKIPALENNEKIVGGLWDQEEDSGDCYKFCRSLVQYMQKNLSVELLTHHAITKINHNDNKIISLSIDKQIDNSVGDSNKNNKQAVTLSADAYVNCLGPQSTQLLKSINIKLPIYPMKGYSVTVPATKDCPDVSITDVKNRVVYCKLGDRLRLAGFAEFSGYSATLKPKRIESILTSAKAFMPTIGDYDTVLDQWCGLRPATPDSLPIVGTTQYENLFLNTGHGMLGWSHALATASILGNMIDKTPQPFDASFYLPNRF